jgi:4-amino-4-deoxy-L-arabinose transferase-like glycosyltransferase
MVARRACALLAIVVVGIGIRAAYTVTTGQRSKGRGPIEGEMAHNILASGRWFEQNTAVDALMSRDDVRDSHGEDLIDPASVDFSHLNLRSGWYPEVREPVAVSAIIAGVWAITGSERYLQAELFQGIVDGLAALLVYWIAMQLFRRPVPAIVAAALYATYPPIAWQTSAAYNDIWAVDLTIATVALYLVALKSSHRWRWLIACGLLVGVGAYMRPQLLLVIPALALVMISETGWREMLRRAATPTLLALLLIVPWVIRNYEDFHAFIPVRGAFWETMWGGLDEIPNDFGANFSEGPIKATMRRVRPDLVFETPAYNAYVEALDKKHFIAVVEQHPWFYLEVLAHRVALATFLVRENLWMRRGAGAVLRYPGGPLAFVVKRPFELLEYALQPLVFILGMLGLWLTRRRWRQQNMLLLAIVVGVLAPFMVVAGTTRYVLPATFVYFIWIGLGVDVLVERIRARTKRALRYARSGLAT